MPTTRTEVLALNSGSSTIKFARFDVADPLRKTLTGTIARVGLAGSTLRVRGPDHETSQSVAVPDHAAAMTTLLDWIDKHCDGATLGGVGHRIVHGGSKYTSPQRITEGMVAELQHLRTFAPEHLPAELLMIEELQRRHPGLPQVACFDTAFHHDLPRVASVLPIPRRYEALGVRRYGFHGLSYAFLMQELTRLTSATVARGRVILAHLGNGVSLAAVQDGRPVDTTMSFTPASGVPMSTRSGDLDPGLAWHLARTHAMSPQQFHEMVNSNSGLLGISETSSDMHDLLAREAQDERAAEAISMFCYAITKQIGAFAAALGGLDTLVFCGGIGENSATVRHRICERLDFLGIELDETQNRENADVISCEARRVSVRVIRTDEEQVIGEAVCRVLELTPT